MAVKDVRQFIRQVDEILFREWDPIGVNNVAPTDEYSHYAPEIAQLLMNGASAARITKRLNELTHKSMGVKVHVANTKRTVAVLTALPKPRRNG
jgi:hypothetical protein